MSSENIEFLLEKVDMYSEKKTYGSPIYINNATHMRRVLPVQI